MCAAAASEPADLIERALRPDDAGRLEALSDAAGWNQTAEDWRLMLTLGAGWGLWTEDGEPAASALVVPYEDRLAWLSMVLVAEPWRRRGLATRLTRRCLDWIAERRLLPLLDATDLGRRIYGKLGFEALWGFSRMGAARPALAAEAGCEIRAMAEGDLAAVAALDALGARRDAVLAHLRAREPRRAFVACEGGEVTGFALARDGRRALHLGPVIAAETATACALAARALADPGGAAVIDVPDGHAGFREALQAAGFAPRRAFTRMSLGGAPAGEQARLYAVAGPEYG